VVERPGSMIRGERCRKSSPLAFLFFPESERRIGHPGQLRNAGTCPILDAEESKMLDLNLYRIILWLWWHHAEPIGPDPHEPPLD
jgi:hypothetical protein